MDVNWCLHCNRLLPPSSHPHPSAFCSPACEASDALSPYTSTSPTSPHSPPHLLAGGTLIPSLLRTHHRAPSYGQPPSPTASRRAARQSFMSARDDFARTTRRPAPEDAVSLSSASSGSPPYPPQYASAPAHTRRTSKRGLLPTPSTSPTAAAAAAADPIQQLAQQLGRTLLSGAPHGHGHGAGVGVAYTGGGGGAGEEERDAFEAFGRGHDRAYYAKRERYRALPVRPAGGAMWDDGFAAGGGGGGDGGGGKGQARPITIVGKVQDLEVRKRWEEQREVGTPEEEGVEEEEGPRREGGRAREGGREGRRRERAPVAVGGEERGRGRERRRK